MEVRKVAVDQMVIIRVNTIMNRAHSEMMALAGQTENDDILETALSLDKLHHDLTDKIGPRV